MLVLNTIVPQWHSKMGKTPKMFAINVLLKFLENVALMDILIIHEISMK